MNILDVNVKKDIKIVFMGTPDFSVPILKELIKNYKVKAVVTQPDKLVGRQALLSQPPVKKVALENNILVLQFDNIKEQYQEVIDLEPDMIITCAYGQILPKELLDCPKYGCINVHASLLPKLRGGAPIHRAIMNGDKITGVTIMYMAPGMDDGDIISSREEIIAMEDTAETLHDKLSILGSKLLIDTLPSIINGTNKRVKQNSANVTYAPIIKPIDEKLDFSKTAMQVANKIRGLNSFPGAYFVLDGKRVKAWSAIIKDDYYPTKLTGEIVKIYDEGIGIKVSNGVVVLTVIQPEGKSKMSAISYINGIKESLLGKIVD